MTEREIEIRIREIEWLSTSAALRSRVLAGAPMAPPVTWSDRVWFSRTFRWSVAAAVVAMIAVGQWSGHSLDRGRETQAAGSLTVAAETVRDLAIEAGLPADAAASLARRSMVAHGPLSTSTRTMILQQLIEADGGH